MSKWLHRGAVAISVSALAGLICLTVLPDDIKVNIAPLFRNLAAGLFLTAGVLFMAVWRLTTQWTAARAALLFLVLGTLLPATTVLRLITSNGIAVQTEAPETRLVLAVPLAILALAAARRNRALLRRTVATLVTVAVLVPLPILAVSGNRPSDESHATLWLISEAVTAAIWTAFAVQSLILQRGVSTARAVVVMFALLAAADVASAWAVTDAGAPRGAAYGLQLLAAMLAVYSAATRLTGSIRGYTGGSGLLSRALVDTEERLAAVERTQRQRLHDASSAALGVVGASHLLADGASLTSADSALLNEMVKRELDRLQDLLRIDDSEPITDFDLGEAIAAVLVSRRLDGLNIATDLDDVHVLGHARATATVIDNLLRNIERHAPGARALICARTVGDETIVTVTDDGPGIRTAEHAAVLRAGTRGSNAHGDGHGLGLYSAASAMQAQAGSLTLGSAPGSGVEVTLRFRAGAARPAVRMAS